jgi:rod shape-determining protein MreC
MGFFRKNWRITVIIVAAIAAGGFVLEHFMGFNPISAAVNTVASPVKNGFSYIADAVMQVRDFVWDMRAYKEDNEKLESEIIKLKSEARDISAYKEENERLEALLDLKENMDGYNTVAARVVSYSQSGLYREIELNRGTASGIKKGDAVITPDGVVGCVREAGPSYSLVTTILDKSSVIGIKVARTEGMGLVEGDDELAKDLKCKLSFLDRNTPVIVGDVIETSGSGGVYPAGLAIGSVLSVRSDSTGALNFAVIDPAVDFSLLREVLVITGVK